MGTNQSGLRETQPGSTIRLGSYRIRLENNWIHDCYTGVAGPASTVTDPAQRMVAYEITISENLIERMPSDGIQFAEWDRVTIERNHIRDIADTNCGGDCIHNDTIQFVGDSSDVRIAGNRLEGAHQQVFIQPARGPIGDVVVENNLMSGALAYAVQVQGQSDDVRLVGNTVWDSALGALLIRDYAGQSPANVIVANNILDFYGTIGAATTTYRDYNIIGRTASTPNAHELVGVDPEFVDPAAGNYHILPTSPATGAGSLEYATLFSIPALAEDFDGDARLDPPSIGGDEP